MFKLGMSSKIKKLAKMLNLSEKQVASADLVCGYSCPCADKCKSYADRITGKLTDAPTCEYRCYGASLEAAFPSVRALHWNNFDLLRHAKTTGEMTDIILAGINPQIKVLRVHSFGDFFNKKYFKAWLNVAEYLPKISFFSYTKVLPYLSIARPDNFKMVYSYGGKLDEQLTDEPTAYVVNSVLDAEKLGIEVSCQSDPSDDYNFIQAGKSFALVLHGTQPSFAKALTA